MEIVGFESQELSQDRLSIQLFLFSCYQHNMLSRMFFFLFVSGSSASHSQAAFLKNRNRILSPSLVIFQREWMASSLGQAVFAVTVCYYGFGNDYLSLFSFCLSFFFSYTRGGILGNSNVRGRLREELAEFCSWLYLLAVLSRWHF